MSTSDNSLNRRKFVRQSACGALGLTGMVNTIAHLKLLNAAIAQSPPPTGYKALVVLFLFGGNDSNNTLIPQMDHAEYTNYKNARGILKIFDPTDSAKGVDDPASISLGNADNSTSRLYGIHPSMQPVADMYNAGDLAFVANTGTLTEALDTQADYRNGLKLKPPQLFSHSDQQLQWQSSVPDRPFTTGWGGRIADLLHESYSSNQVSMSISLSGINSLEVGNEVVQYAVSPTGAISLAGYGTNYASALTDINNPLSYNATYHGKRLKAFDDVMRFTHAHLLEQGYNDVVGRARKNESLIGQALTDAGTAPTGSAQTYDQIFYTPGTTTTTSLAGQLKMIAKLIAGSSKLGNTRQIFFCSVGGYDTHQSQLSAHATLMTELANGLGAFKTALTALNVYDSVLTMTHSDFTRTLTPNGTDTTGSGSDHGWGGHQIVMGGGVNGKRIYGSFPTLTLNTGRDVDIANGRGRWIPTTSVDQYAAVAANWFGAGGSLSTIFPNLSRFRSITDPLANLAYI
jgi:uncharacterized protein (DUF1501 family)